MEDQESERTGQSIELFIHPEDPPSVSMILINSELVSMADGTLVPGLGMSLAEVRRLAIDLLEAAQLAEFGCLNCPNQGDCDGQT